MIGDENRDCYSLNKQINLKQNIEVCEINMFDKLILGELVQLSN